MVSLMDRLLKLENLDMHLTPYGVLATGQDEGMMEFIPSSSLAQVNDREIAINGQLPMAGWQLCRYEELNI